MAQVFRTAITELFGIEHPILLGGMHDSDPSRLVADVVSAGAMGFITPRDVESLLEYRDDLRRCRDLTQGRPFGVNLATSRRPGCKDSVHAWIDIAFEEGVRHFGCSGALPADLIGPVHDRGGTLIYTCTGLRDALAAERLGVDAIALVGLDDGAEAGAPSLPASANVAAALHRLRVPVVLGGDMGSGHQIAAALALGAAGIMITSDAAAIEPPGAVVTRLVRDATRAAYAFAGTFGAPARADALRST